MKTVFKKLILLSATLIFSCAENKNPCSLSEEVLQDISFVDSMMNNSEQIMESELWMKENYNESSVFSAKNETYRFIWESSFDGTKVYRIEKFGDQYLVNIGVFSDYHDSITKDKHFEFNITKDIWIEITNHMNSNGFWTYKSLEHSMGLDGARWHLEGYKPIKDKCTNKNYHRIYRWSPREDTAFISMCKQLYNLKPSGELY